MTDGTKTLYMTVLSKTDRTLMLGRSDGNGGNNMPAGRSNATGGVGNAGPFDLTQRIVDPAGNEWTIVEVGPWAFYNN